MQELLRIRSAALPPATFAAASNLTGQTEHIDIFLSQQTQQRRLIKPQPMLQMIKGLTFACRATPFELQQPCTPGSRVIRTAGGGVGVLCSVLLGNHCNHQQSQQSDGCCLSMIQSALWLWRWHLASSKQGGGRNRGAAQRRAPHTMHLRAAAANTI